MVDEIHYPTDFPVVTRATSVPIMDIPDFEQPQSIFDLLNFRLAEFMSLSGSLVTRMCEGEFGITRQEWQFIAMLATMGSATPSELARRTTIDRSQGSKTLRVLVDKKLIRRERFPHDRRRALIHLTERGQQLHHTVFPRTVAIHQAVMDCLDRDERRQLAQWIQRLHQRVEEVARSRIVDVPASRRKGGSRAAWRDPGDLH
jgi:DNA-binding MarR family transcriptional regulator